MGKHWCCRRCCFGPVLRNEETGIIHTLAKMSRKLCLLFGVPGWHYNHTSWPPADMISLSGTVPPETRDHFTGIIDSILSQSDLTTISEKRIRRGLQDAVGYDLTPQKVCRWHSFAWAYTQWERRVEVLVEPCANVSSSHLDCN